MMIKMIDIDKVPKKIKLSGIGFCKMVFNWQKYKQKLKSNLGAQCYIE